MIAFLKWLLNQTIEFQNIFNVIIKRICEFQLYVLH